MREPATEQLVSRAAGHPVLLAVIEHWRLTNGEYDLADELERYSRMLDELRASLDTVLPRLRRPAAPQRAAADAIVARFDQPEAAWRACIDAGLIPATWLDDPQRRFFDDDGNVVGHPRTLSDVAALAADRDGVLAAEAHMRRIARALAPWGHREPDEFYWIGWPYEFDIACGPVRAALHVSGTVHVLDLYDLRSRRSRTLRSAESAAIGSSWWRDPQSQLWPRANKHFPIIDRFAGKPTATLPDPFGEMLGLLSTGYGFELQGNPAGSWDHVLLVPEPLPDGVSDA